MVKANMLSALFILAIGRAKRAKLAALTIVMVSGMTGYALLGMLPFFNWVSVQAGLFLSSMNLVFMAVYFEFISPSRSDVSSKVTSCLAILGGIISTLTANAVHPIPLFEQMYFVAASAFLLLIVAVWFWYEIIYLRSFRQHVESATELAPMPDSVENALIEDDDENEEKLTNGRNN